MSALSNHRRELFAQLLVQGFSAVDAHEKAGFKRNDGNASTLARHPEIEARIMEIKGELVEPKGEQAHGPMPLGTSIIAAKANLTAQDLIRMQDDFRVKAWNSGQLSAGVNAVKEMSILAGRRVERSEIGSPGEFEAMSDSELITALQERFAKLMAELRLPITNGSIALNGNATDTDIEG
jgi:hypothetical protein